MSVHGVPSFKEYAKFLDKTPSEIDALFRELLISVTSFFRDPDAFEALTRHMTKLVASRADNGPLRVWVPGCSTGEEAYSIAIVLKEIQYREGVNFDAQIFATDLDVAAVDAARAGRYPEGISADMSRDRLQRFFVREDSGYRVSKELRELLIFAAQNIIKDPPFTKLDLLSCRNLLIYLEPDVQKRVLSLFSYSVRPGGLLLLGTSESVGVFDDRFLNVDKKWKLFQRKHNVAADSLPVFPAELPNPPLGMHGSTNRPSQQPGSRTIGPLAERALLGSFVPPSVLVNDRGDLLYVHGRTGPFLEPAPGEPVNNVFQMAREGLKLELPVLVRQATSGDGPIVRHGLRVKSNGGFVSVRATARRLDEPDAMRGAILLSFEIEPEQEPEHHPKGQGRQEPARARLAHQGAGGGTATHERKLAGDNRGAGNLERGAQEHERRAPIYERGASKRQRGARDVAGGNAIAERRAPNRKRRVRRAEPRAVSGERRHAEPLEQHRHRDDIFGRQARDQTLYDAGKEGI